MRLANKTALVTGAASGMGAATARLFAREGAKVAVADMLEGDGQAVVAAITVRALIRNPVSAPTWIHQLLELDDICHDPLAADIRFDRS